MFVFHQTSRYYYVPLVGLGIIVGQGLVTILEYFGDRNLQKAAFGICLIFLIVIIYFIIGINLEEQDYDYFGEMHRQAAESFKQNILPIISKDTHTMVVFLRPDSRRFAESLDENFRLKPWYLPRTYKWIYVRSYGIFGLSNTYAFVTYCAYNEVKNTLFVNVPYEEFREQMLSGEYYIVMHDYTTNTFRFGSDALKAELKKRIDDKNFYRYLQPGQFDPTNAGNNYPQS
jgi:hypothetical protein